jgi:hypothetical protein
LVAEEAASQQRSERIELWGTTRWLRVQRAAVESTRRIATSSAHLHARNRRKVQAGGLEVTQLLERPRKIAETRALERFKLITVADSLCIRWWRDSHKKSAAYRLKFQTEPMTLLASSKRTQQGGELGSPCAATGVPLLVGVPAHSQQTRFFQKRKNK